MSQAWIPVPGTTTGRLVEAALALFGANGYDSVSVTTIATQAGVTTGSLYHHFASKSRLYALVRADVEQRVLDRLEGARAALPVGDPAQLATVLLVGFDYLVSSGFTRLLSDEAPDHRDGAGEPDAVERLVRCSLGGDNDSLAAMIAAAWRNALQQASTGHAAASQARHAFRTLLTGTR